MKLYSIFLVIFIEKSAFGMISCWLITWPFHFPPSSFFALPKANINFVRLVNS